MGDSSETNVYPTDHMRAIANAISKQADDARSQHDQKWHQITHFIQNNFDPSLHDALTNLLKPHADRIRASYDWQSDLASALIDAANQVDAHEKQTKDSFTP
jgi:hypothetical protein